VEGSKTLTVQNGHEIQINNAFCSTLFKIFCLCNGWSRTLLYLGEKWWGRWMGSVGSVATDNAGPVGSEMVHQLNSLDMVSIISRVHIYASRVLSVALPLQEPEWLKSGWPRVSEAIASLRNEIIPSLLLLLPCLF
jgi:hypothetical protein